MRNRVLLLAGATALVAASCAQPEPQVLSEAPRSASATEVASPTTTTTERDEQPGRFIARCATEADGGTPGLTIFTDGSQNVTDHCLSRYYIGVQPAPGALYVPDEEAGPYAPSETAPADTTAQQWTPAQPRTDTGPEEDRALLEDGDTTGDQDETDTEDPATADPDAPGTPDDGTSPTSPTTPPTTDPGGSEPGETDPTTPGTTDPDTTTPGPTEPGETGPTEPGSSEPTAVPTVTETPQAPQPGPLTSVMSSDPFGSAGSQSPAASQAPTASQAPAGSQTPTGFSGFRWPGSFWPGGPQN